MNGGNTIQSNYLGTDPSGTTDLGNGSIGVRVLCNNNLIGGATSCHLKRFFAAIRRNSLPLVYENLRVRAYVSPQFPRLDRLHCRKCKEEVKSCRKFKGIGDVFASRRSDCRGQT